MQGSWGKSDEGLGASGVPRYTKWRVSEDWGYLILGSL